MQIVPVSNPLWRSEFLEINARLQAENPSYHRPLNKDIEEVFDPKRNKTFRHGEVERWLLVDDGGKTLGRIAAFVNKKYRNKGDDLPVGGCGFFDAPNDSRAATMLFDTAKSWLAERGMEAMDGPINFGERDKWWGLVVEGFAPPLYGMNYNPPYYQSLFEGYGFQPFFHQLCFGILPKSPLGAKVVERHAHFAAMPDFRVRSIDKKNLEKGASDFATVYNAAWAGHGGLKELKESQVLGMLRKMKPVMDPEIIWFAYHDEQPIALFVNLPDLNAWFGKLNGQFDLLHKLKFLWLKRTQPTKKFTGLVFGIVPEWQGKGIDSFIVGEAHKALASRQYEEYEMQWIGDFNPKMINVAQGLGDVSVTRKLTTYRYLFDRQREFKRHPML